MNGSEVGHRPGFLSLFQRDTRLSASSCVTVPPSAISFNRRVPLTWGVCVFCLVFLARSKHKTLAEHAP